MLIHALRAPVFATNTLVLAPHDDATAVVVDPGAGVAPLVHDVLARRRLRVGAILLTHGHPDHLWDLTAVTADVPVLIGADDAERLADPAAHIGELGPLWEQLTDGGWQPVRDVQPVGTERVEPVPGVVLDAIHAPGHTAGSTVWQLAAVDELTGPVFAEVGVTAYAGPVVLTGDVLFAGSVGRTDLPGGDEGRMRQTLRGLGTSLPPDALLVPGHGPASTMSRELATNPFLTRALG